MIRTSFLILNTYYFLHTTILISQFKNRLHTFYCHYVAFILPSSCLDVGSILPFGIVYILRLTFLFLLIFKFFFTNEFCHSGLVSESHSICHFEVSRNLFLSFFKRKKRNKKRLAVNLSTKNVLIPLKILQTLRAKTFLTLHSNIFLT